MKIAVPLLLFVFLFSSCNKDDDTPLARLPDIDGLALSQSESGFSTTYESIRANLENNKNINIVTEVNHSENASSVGQQLDNTRLLVFGNPDLGTPLIQQNQLAALDLPQKILIYQQGDDVFAAYNTTAYLASRYNLDVELLELERINNALSEIVTDGTNVVPSLPDTDMVASKEGIITVDSKVPFNTTYNNLRTAISENANLSIITEVDHQANGDKVGKNIRPTRLIIFGNPNLGTSLMQESQTIGIDLPQKILVWLDDAGIAHLSYNDPVYLVNRHDINGANETIATITTALESLTAAAIN